MAGDMQQMVAIGQQLWGKRKTGANTRNPMRIQNLRMRDRTKCTLKSSRNTCVQLKSTECAWLSTQLDRCALLFTSKRRYDGSDGGKKPGFLRQKPGFLFIVSPGFEISNPGDGALERSKRILLTLHNNAKCMFFVL